MSAIDIVISTLIIVGEIVVFGLLKFKGDL